MTSPLGSESSTSGTSTALLASVSSSALTTIRVFGEFGTVIVGKIDAVSVVEPDLASGSVGSCPEHPIPPRNTSMASSNPKKQLLPGCAMTQRFAVVMGERLTAGQVSDGRPACQRATSVEM